MTFTQKAAQNSIVQTLVVWSGLFWATNKYLDWRPINGRFGQKNLRYRIRRAENLITAKEIFEGGAYQQAIQPTTKYVVDIGCNTGYFLLYCTEMGDSPIQGIAVDANVSMVEETFWHLKANSINDVHAICGLAGAPEGQAEAFFYISPTNIASSASSAPNPNVPAKGSLKKVAVPAIDVNAQWENTFPGKEIDILKIDVEGFEKELIPNSLKLIAKSKAIVIEVHKWVVSIQEIVGALTALGFNLVATCEDTDHAAVLYFERKLP